MSDTRKLIIIYNADASMRGKLNYAYRKLTSSSKEDPACAACDITHGGLSLSEVPGWTKAKSDIEAQGWQVVQWHRDEVDSDTKYWVGANDVKYPVVLAAEGEKDLRVVMEAVELADCAGDATKLVDVLREKKVLGDDGSSTTASSSL